MPVRKVAISIDAKLLEEADRLAREGHLTRSGLIGRLLSAAAKESRDRAITDSLDAVFGDPATGAEQERLTRERYPGERFGDEE
jgi:hypothetical protein